MPDAAAQTDAAHPRIAVVGGGFTGAMFALHLLRDHAGGGYGLDIVEPRATLGAGLAYSTSDPEHRINVAAARMSPFPEEDDEHFDRWLRAEGVPAGDPQAVTPDGRLFARRAMVGRYVDTTLRDAVAQRPDVAFRHLRQRALAAEPHADGTTLTLDDGTAVTADVVVLAVGHPPPVLPAALRGWAADPRVVANPWDQARIDAIPRAAPVLIVGTGLTACDVIASLRARGHAAPITAVSRHGLLPRARTALPVEPCGDFATDPARTAAALLRRVREAIAARTAALHPWEDVIDALRRQGRDVWGALPPVERRRLLRHARAFWDAHRYQCAPRIAALLAAEQASGGLRVRAASVRVIASHGPALHVTLAARHSAATSALEVGAVVACTGPGHVSVVASNPILRSLAAAGALRADGYGLGIDVDRDGRCVGADGRAAPALFVVGPLARGTEGELMGLPQVSTQPRAVAAVVAGIVAGMLAQPAGMPARR